MVIRLVEMGPAGAGSDGPLGWLGYGGGYRERVG